MKFTKHRVIKQGSIPNSVGGVFNPAVKADTNTLNQRTIICRREPTPNWNRETGIVMFIDKIEKLRMGEVDNYHELKLVGYPPNSKFEDGRLFYYKNELYIIHTLVLGTGHWTNSEYCAPVIAKVSRHSLTFTDWVELPGLKRNKMEKNWLPFVWKDELHLIYSLDPLRIFKLEGWSWRMVQEVDTGLGNYLKKLFPESSMLSLSAAEVIDDAIIGFWHHRVKDVYRQGMFRIEMPSMKLTHFTKALIFSEGLEGYKPSCLFISDMVVTATTIEAWAGEADSHTMVIEIDKQEAIDTVMASPYSYKAPLKIRFNDKGVGDCICALYAVVGWMRANPGRTIKLYSNVNHEVISAFRIPGIELWMDLSNERVDIDLSSNQDHITSVELRAEYQKKLQSSFKVWYSNKLGVTPAIPDTTLVEAAQGYDDAIIVFPFSSAWEDRNWPKDNWIELTHRLINAGHRVIVSDQYIARIEKFPGELKITTSIGELMSIIKGVKLCVTNESGGAHIAGLLGTKCLVLSGGLDPAIVNDLTDNDFIYKKPLQTISVDDVYNKLISML